MESEPNRACQFAPIEVRGALHIHTTDSDGGVNYADLIAAAEEVGLDFIVVNDHMTLRAKREGREGFHGRLLVVVGYEHNDVNNRNHYLALGADKVADAAAKPQGYIDTVKQAGGIGFLAHPMERRHYFAQYPPFPWTDWSVSGYDGIEVWNQMSEWVENLKTWFSHVRIFYPRRFLSGIPPALAERWDAVNRQRFVAGIGGVDAHTIKMKFGPLRFRVFPIKVELKGLRTHLYLDHPLPDNGAEAVKTLLGTLKAGRGYISNFRRGDATGTRIFLRAAGGECLAPGEPACQCGLPAVMNVTIPRRADIRLVCNGNTVKQVSGSAALFSVEREGVYRIEVFVKKRAWIYSNPFPVGKYPL